MHFLNRSSTCFRPFSARSIAITGASSGLGKALAEALAAPERLLFLSGRDSRRLEATKQQCEARGATVIVACVDVCDRTAMECWIRQCDQQRPLDLVIANAGISAGTGGKGESAEQIRAIFATNIDGVLNTVLPVLPFMRVRNRGHIAIISSLAGIRALPSSPAYSSSKAAVRYLGEAWRGELRHTGITVSVVCPGYIHTPMTEVNRFPMPFIMNAEQAALRIIDGLQHKQGRIAFPRRLYYPLWWLACLSPRLTDAFFAALPAKSSMEEKV